MDPAVQRDPTRSSSPGSETSLGRRGSTTRRTTFRRRWPGCVSPKTSFACTPSASPESKASLEPEPTAQEDTLEGANDASFDAPVANVWRGDFVESVHRGRYAVRSTEGEAI